MWRQIWYTSCTEFKVLLLNLLQYFENLVSKEDISASEAKQWSSKYTCYILTAAFSFIPGNYLLSIFNYNQFFKIEFTTYYLSKLFINMRTCSKKLGIRLLLPRGIFMTIMPIKRIGRPRAYMNLSIRR